MPSQPCFLPQVPVASNINIKTKTQGVVDPVIWTMVKMDAVAGRLPVVPGGSVFSLKIEEQVGIDMLQAGKDIPVNINIQLKVMQGLGGIKAFEKDIALIIGVGYTVDMVTDPRSDGHVLQVEAITGSKAVPGPGTEIVQCNALRERGDGKDAA